MAEPLTKITRENLSFDNGTIWKQGDIINAAKMNGVCEKINQIIDTTTASLQEIEDNFNKLAYKGYITPEVFQAKGDGVTDDTAALQSAFDRIQSTGETLFFPTGKVYKTTSPITLKHDGHYTVTGVKGTVDAPNIINNDSYMFIGNVYNTQISNCYLNFSNLFLRGMRVTCFKGISIYGTSIIHNCSFYFFSYWLQGSLRGYTRVEHCRFQGIRRAVISGYVLNNDNIDLTTLTSSETISSAVLYSAKTNDSVFINNNYFNLSDENKGSYAFVGNFDEDVHITNCWFQMGRAVHLITEDKYISPMYSNCVFQRFVNFYENTCICTIRHANFIQCQFMTFNDEAVVSNHYDGNDTFAVFQSKHLGQTIYLDLYLSQCEFVSCTKSVNMIIRATGGYYKIVIDTNCRFEQTQLPQIREKRYSTRRENFISTGKEIYITNQIANNSECPYEQIDGENIYLYPRDAILIYNPSGGQHFIISKMYITEDRKLMIYRIADNTNISIIEDTNGLVITGAN